MDKHLRKLEEVEGRLEELGAALENDAFVQYYQHADVDMAGHEKKIRAALLDRGVAAACDAIREADVEPTVRRRAEIVSHLVTEARAATDEIIELKEEVTRIVITTPGHLDGADLPRHRRTEILFKDDDREKRRRAFFAEGKLREELQDKGRRLLRLRNDAARNLGFESYPALALAAEDLTVPELTAIFDRYDRETTPAYEQLVTEARARFGLGRVEAWDLNYVGQKIFSAPDHYFPRDRGVETLAGVVRGFGRELDELGIPIYADADIPYAGLCFAVRVPDDIRILLNLKDGMAECSVLYHEFGHAAHRKFCRVAPYSLKVGDAGFFAEAMADVWGCLIFRPAWLRKYAMMPEDEIEAVRAGAEMEYASRIRRFMAHQLYEIDAYLDPDGDLDASLDRHTERFLGHRYDDAGMWAQNYFPFLYPMYSKNYMLARVIQRLVHRYLEGQVGELLDTPRTLELLIDHFYADGATTPWKAKLSAIGAAL